MGKEYTIIVNTEKYGWCLHCLAGYSREQAEKRLAREKAEHPHLELAIQEYTEQEANECWWNKYGCD
jgi:hypothetical protein